MITFETKLGTTRGGERTRIWIEGKRLIDAGFVPGVLFLRHWSAGRLALTICGQAAFDEAPRNERGTVSGKGEKPIIDVTGAIVADTFTGSHVKVTYKPGRIAIVGA